MTSAKDLPHPVSLKNDGDALVIAWNDGAVHRLKWTDLRKACPCATCRGEREHAEPPPLLPVLKPQEAQPLKPTAMHPMGNYAYSIHFSDGHNTGIYSLEFLRGLGESAEGL
jgi:DUF971 family protein